MCGDGDGRMDGEVVLGGGGVGVWGLRFRVLGFRV